MKDWLPKGPRILIPFRRMTRSRALPWVLAVVFLGTTLTNWWWLHNERRHDAEVDAVQTTARNFLAALTNFSADTIKDDVQHIRSYAVGGFAQQVDQTFSSTRIDQIQKAKVVSKSRVRSVFVESVTGDQSTVFGVVDESVTNSTSATPRTDEIRVEVGMIDTSSGWKVDSVNILQTPGAGAFPGGG